MNQEKRLESWKEIEAYLKRDFRTLRRWEKEEGLPIHRHSHKIRASVYAYPGEIDAWRAGRKIVPEPVAKPLWKIPAFALTMALCLVMVGNGVRPVAAQQAGKGMTVRQVSSPGFADSISADGRYVSFPHYGLQGALVIQDLAAGTMRTLTDFGTADFRETVQSPVISPDGKQVAYTHKIDWGQKMEVSIVPFSGGRSKSVFRSDETKSIDVTDWTPDGKQLLVQHTLRDNTTQIAMVSIQDGKLRVVKSFSWAAVGSARLSPDGRFIAYDAPASENTPAHDIFVLAVDGTGETKAVESPAVDWSPRWSPDGTQLLFLSDRAGSPGLWSAPLQNGKARGSAQLIKPDVGFIQLVGVTRNGALHYLSEGLGRRNVYTAGLDGELHATASQLASDRSQNISAGASFSPDGQYLAYFAQHAPNEMMLGLTRLIIRTLKSGQERELNLPSLRIPPYGYLTPPNWFPDGKSVLVAAWDTSRPEINYYRVDLASGATELVHRSRGSRILISGIYDLTSDGKTLFYLDTLNSENQVSIMRFDLATRRTSELRSDAALRGLALSPDGKQLAYFDLGTQSFYVVPVAGGEPRLVYKRPTRGNAYVGITWSPDQRYLILVLPDTGRDYAPQALYKVPVTGDQPVKLGIASNGEIFTPRVFGNQIAYTTREFEAQAVWALENFLPKAKGK